MLPYQGSAPVADPRVNELLDFLAPLNQADMDYLDEVEEIMERCVVAIKQISDYSDAGDIEAARSEQRRRSSPSSSVNGPPDSRQSAADCSCSIAIGRSWITFSMFR
jgi:hypothetical protein